MRAILITWLLLLQSSFLAALTIPMKKEGELTGILTSKGEAWVEVREDDGFTNRYLAPWLGGSPSKGGKFDPRVLQIIRQSVVGNRVRMKWRHDGHLRVRELSILVPREKEGIFTGSLIEIGDHWVEFENSDDRIPWRFYLRWIGGYPENGGGYDGKSRQELTSRSDESLFRFRWSYDVRPRFERLLELESFQEPLFYQPEELQTPSDAMNPPSAPAAPVNPFEGAPAAPVNPFEGAPAAPVNPFEGAPAAPVNPFEGAPAAPVNPFEGAPAAPVNPFEGAPAAPVNPFEGAPAAPINPFEGQKPK